MAASLTEIATRHQVFLERLKTREATDFVAVLDDLEKLVMASLATLDSGKINQAGRAEINTLLRDLRVKETVLLRANEVVFLETLKGITGYEASLEQRVLQRSLISEIGKNAPKVRLPNAEVAWAEVVRRPLTATGTTVKPFIRNWSNATIAKVEQSILRGWAEGRTVADVTTEIRGTKANKYKDGIVRGLSKRQGEAVARTSVQHVSSAGRMATWERNQDIVKEYRFIATLDSRTTTRCSSLDQRTFKMNAGPIPPIHINCRSTTVAVPLAKYDFLSEGSTRASKTGSVSGKESYYSWLKKQPQGFQAEAIGPTRAKLLRDGGISAEKFSALQLDKNFQALTLDEMRILEPKLFERAGV